MGYLLVSSRINIIPGADYTIICLSVWSLVTSQPAWNVKLDFLFGGLVKWNILQMLYCMSETAPELQQPHWLCSRNLQRSSQQTLHRYFLGQQKLPQEGFSVPEISAEALQLHCSLSGLNAGEVNEILKTLQGRWKTFLVWKQAIGCRICFFYFPLHRIKRQIALPGPNFFALSSRESCLVWKGWQLKFLKIRWNMFLYLWQHYKQNEKNQ